MIQKYHKNLYLDHAASTPIDSAVLSEMYTYDVEHFSNPSSVYSSGDSARRELESQRTSLARVLQARTPEIYFTYGGTESDNLAIRGVVSAYKRMHPEKVPHIIVSSIEHVAVLDTVAALEKEGVEVTYIKPKKNGVVRALDCIEACKANTILVSLMYVNNEIGTVQPVGALGKLIREYREKHNTAYPYVHTDACQAGNYVLVTAPKLKADLISISASKVYGPKGIGALYVRSGTHIDPIITGGGQEHGLRSGTPNISQIIGLVSSFAKAQNTREEETARLQEIQKWATGELATRIPHSIIWGELSDKIPNNISVCVPGISAEELVIRLSAYGIEVSSKSACSSIDTDGSYVILEIGGTELQSRQTIRISMGRDTNKEDIEYFLDKIELITKQYSI